MTVTYNEGSLLNALEYRHLYLLADRNAEAGNGFGLHTSQVSKSHRITAFKVSDAGLRSQTADTRHLWLACGTNYNSGSLPPRYCTRLQHAVPSCRLG